MLLSLIFKLTDSESHTSRDSNDSTLPVMLFMFGKRKKIVTIWKMTVSGAGYYWPTYCTQLKNKRRFSILSTATTDEQSRRSMQNRSSIEYLILYNLFMLKTVYRANITHIERLC